LLTGAALSGVIAFAGSPAFAQAPPADGSAPATAGPATGPDGAKPADSADPVERARVHYERGLQLFNEENYDAALFEFERAYELAPSYKILYNMGRIQRQQHNYAAAMRSYSRYLREGGAGVPADRKTEVENEISVLKPRVALLTVKVNVDGADVYADDIPVCTATIESACVGKSPLQSPIIVNGGRHKVTATKKGYAPATALVSVVGSDAVDVNLELVSYDRPVAPPTNPFVIPTIIGWSVTGIAVIAGSVTGVLANNARDDQRDAVNRFGVTRDELDASRQKTIDLGNVTDGLFIGAGVAAVVSGYLTFRALRWKGGSTESNVQVGVGSVKLSGTF
jgi:hypothetical protein